ncbi:MAG TPA: potassium channel family protein [Desulfobacter sp.]|nr:potassium channel family protein [Desulfobacter sp.]
MLRVFIQNKYTILLCIVLLNVISAPFFSQSDHPGVFFNTTFSLIILTAVLSVVDDKKLSQAASIALMLPCLFFVWQAYFYIIEEHMLMASAVVQAIFLAYMSLLIILFVFRAPIVTRDVVSAALVVYLFLAMFFAKLYLILELAYPGSFSLPHEAIRDKPGLLRYFSMVTLSTLGYGDLSPVNDKSQTLAGMEAIFGQIYMAVLIARLVGMQGGSIKKFSKK